MAGSDVRESALDLNKVSKDDSILEEAAKWREQGHKVALATVVQTWGSSPRPAGSQLAVHEDGSFVGSVSGGCIEGAVVTEALEVMQSGTPKVLKYGVTDDLAWEVGLACGGQVRVFVEALD
jgi:xanthine/CO dehydrogenase XdhC/CoxF family maturation factor